MLNQGDILALAWEYSEGSGKRYTFTEESLLEMVWIALSQQDSNEVASPAQDELEAVERFSPTTSVPHCGRASEVETYMTEDDDGEYMTVAQHERIVAALTRPAQTALQPLYQVRRYGEGWQDVDHTRYVACRDDREYYTRELYVALAANKI